MHFIIRPRFLLTGLLATFWLISGCGIACSSKNKSCSTKGAMKSKTLQISALHDGPIPEAMQWKRTPIFALSMGEDQPLLKYLQELQEAESEEVLSPLAPEIETKPARLYLLLGWSTGGLDELRAAKLDSAIIQGGEIQVWLWKPTREPTEGGMGTADMKFIGWQIDLGELALGKYTAKLYVRHGKVRYDPQEIRQPIGEPELAKEIKFRIGRDK